MTAGSVVTLTLNPAIDETIVLDRLIPGTVHRARVRYQQAGGKGVNVSSMLSQYGIPSIATGFLGRGNTAIFEALFQSHGIKDRFVRIDGETRTGIKIISESIRETTDINFPGPTPQPGDFHQLRQTLANTLQTGDWLVVAGSLSAGTGLSDFRSLLSAAKGAGARIAVDTNGPALLAAIEAGAELIKPNLHELEEVLGKALPDTSSRKAAASELQKSGVSHVILSLGSEGALFSGPEGTWLASAPPVNVASTVGAGDSMLAGYLAGMLTGMAAADRARLASVFSWCAIEDIARRLCPVSDIPGRMAAIQVVQL